MRLCVQLLKTFSRFTLYVQCEFLLARLTMLWAADGLLASSERTKKKKNKIKSVGARTRARARETAV